MPKHIGADRQRLNKTLAQALGAELTNLRTEKHWSQEYVAHRLGYDETYIRKVERGTANPTLQLLCNFADLFGVSLSDLICRAEDTAAKASNSTRTPSSPK